jgi:peptidoglycan/xylan/chitin deacetylase (PgdA/CDA1 family)
MPDVSIPGHLEMLLPTLEALDELGASGTRGEVDAKTIDLMGLTPAQMAVEFPPGARQKGPKVVHRLSWARTNLKKLGAIDNRRRGFWTLEGPGRKYLEMDPAEAATALRSAHAEATKGLRARRRAAAAHSQRPGRGAESGNVEVLGTSDDSGFAGVGVHRSSLARSTKLSRRTVLKVGLAGIGGLVLAASGVSRSAAAARRRPVNPATLSGARPSAPAPPVPTTEAPPLHLPVSAPARRVYDLHPDGAPNAIALTIDDGPDPAWTPAVLDELAANGVGATFSMIGRWVVAYPDLARRVVAAGHAICNHSMTHHIPFTSLSPDRIEAEVAGTSTAILQATGMLPRVFRSPGGDWSPAVLASVASHGMRPVQWDVDPRDWQRPGTSVILGRMLAAQPGDIVLCHDGGGDRSETVAALRTAILTLKSRGLAFVTL